MFHHYVSQFYLNSWKTEVDGRPKRIWIYAKGEAPRHGAIRRIAGEEDFYAIEDSGHETDNVTVEDFLRVSESKSAPVFRKIDNEEPLTEKERSQLAEFLTIFWQRSPYQQAKTKTILASILPKNFASFREQLEKFSGEKKAIIHAELDRLEKWHSENPASLFPKLINFDTEVVKMLLSMDWVFTKSSGVELLTSDNPFIYSHGIGLGNLEKGHFMFPLSKHITLQGTHSSNYKDSYVEIEDGLSNDINLRIIRNSFKEVYASYESAELASLVDANIGIDLS